MKIARMIVRLFFIVFLVVFSVIYAILLYSGKQIYEHRSNQISALIKTHPVFFRTIFTDIFPKALECNAKRKNIQSCTLSSRTHIEKLFPEEEILKQNEYKITNQISYPGSLYEIDNTLLLTNTLPLYFITFSNTKIEKLFLSGDVKHEKIDSFGEYKTILLLKGWIHTLYDIHGNDDFLQTTYLNDLYSEQEVIIPYKINGKTIGAIVFLHGD